MMGAHIAIESNWWEQHGRRAAGDLLGFIIGKTDPSTGIANINGEQARQVFNDPCISLKYRDKYIAALEAASPLRTSYPFDKEHFNPPSQDVINAAVDRQVFHNLLQDDLYTLDILAGRFKQAIRIISDTGRRPSIFLVSQYLQWGATDLKGLLNGYASRLASGGGHGVEVVEIYAKAAQVVGVSGTLPTGIEFYNRRPQGSGDVIRFPDESRTVAERPVSEEEYKNWLKPQLGL